MRTAQEHSPTKEKLLKAAQRLMLAKGYEATSVDEICEAARLTKGSFFHYFETKEELAKAAAIRFYEAGTAMMQSAPFRKEKDPLDRLYGYVAFIIEMTRNPQSPKSCLIGNLTQELSLTHPEIRNLCDRCFSHQADDFKKVLDEAKAAYRPKMKLDTQSLSDHFLATIEGSLILYKAKRDLRVIEKNMEHFRRYLEGIFSRQK
jgi:TetR/AcrR family transcriptional repressor of nem operon